MSSTKNRNIACFAAIICLAVGIICYASASTKSPGSQPVRIVFNTVGGNVLFDHFAHNKSYSLSCTECHHSVDSDLEPISQACGDCHQNSAGNITSFGKNGSFDHDMHSEDMGLSCSECHHTYSEDSGEDPQPCSECHNPEDSAGSAVSRESAFHQQCIGCHEDNEITPGLNDCNQCHSPRKKMSALHDQCIGCHEENGAGPSGEDSECNYCHGF